MALVDKKVKPFHLNAFKPITMRIFKSLELTFMVFQLILIGPTKHGTNHQMLYQKFNIL